MVLTIANMQTLKCCAHLSTIPANLALTNPYVALHKICSISTVFLFEEYIYLKLF
jgi:hypothetical protein